MVVAVAALHREHVRAGELAAPLHDADLALLGEPCRPPVSLPTTDSFQSRSASRSISGSPKRDAVRGRLLGLGDHLARRAAAPWTGCSRRSGRRRRASRSARRARSRGRGRRRGRRRCSRPGRRPARAPRRGRRRRSMSAGSGGAASRRRLRARRLGGRRAGAVARGRSGRPRPAASSSRISEPSETVSPTATFSSRTTPAAGEGTSIVALSDSSVISGSSGRHLVAGLDQHLDDRDVGEVADVGDAGPRSGSYTSAVEPSAVAARLLDALLRRLRGVG